MKRLLLVFTCVAFSLAVLLPIVAVWWWALFGMSDEVGVAVTITTIVLMLVGLASGATYTDYKGV